VEVVCISLVYNTQRSVPNHDQLVNDVLLQTVQVKWKAHQGFVLLPFPLSCLGNIQSRAVYITIYKPCDIRFTILSQTVYLP
jgi:hypothetical protein